MGAPALIHGPSVAAYVNGKVLGIVYSMDFTSSTPRKRVMSIDSLIAQELAPVGTSVSGTLGIYRLRGGGGIEGAGLTAPLPDLSQESYFSIVLLDIITKFIIFSARSCSVESQSWSAVTKQYLTGTIAFSGINWQNEVVALNGSQS